jgi:glycine C-acetyltransferase
MPLDRLNESLGNEVSRLETEGRAKSAERVIVDYVASVEDRGPRYRLRGSEQEFIRMNSNSYLSLSHHSRLIEAADEASRRFGVGPGAVRFIDGTFAPHVDLERSVAEFAHRPAARIFNSAYTSILGLAVCLTGPETYWIGDELNHNCIIRAMRMANVPRDRRSIFKHNDVADLQLRLEQVPHGIERVIVIFDGIFSMRGDHAPLDRIGRLTQEHTERFRDGVITVMDDSHGFGAYGETGRGTEEYCAARADILVGTFGKAFGVNGGFVAGSSELVEALRQRADTYIYTNPLSAADCAAAVEAVRLTGGEEGRARLAALRERTKQFRSGLAGLSLESIDGPHPVVPLLVRETERTRRMVAGLYERGVLAVGLTFPVVPRGDETIRFQLNAAHTERDIDEVLSAVEAVRA